MTAAISFRGLDLHAGGLRLQLSAGYAEPVSVRGKDTIVPGKAGRTVRARVADVRALHLEGYIAAADAASWRIATDSLAAVMDTSADPGPLVLTGPYLGIPPGTTATLNARVVNAVGGPIVAQLFQRWSIELESVDPDWVLT